MTDLRFDGPPRAAVTLVLAHGAGAPMDSPFMTTIARAIAARGIRVARFEFPYMAARRTGGRRPPDREPILRATWLEVVAALGGGPAVVIGGKSLGGRIASLVADECGARGLVCLGYPFAAPGRDATKRIAHLATLTTPALILQGTRDSFGGPDAVAAYALSPTIRIEWIPDGDHSFKPRKQSGRSEDENLAEAASKTAAFVAGLNARS